MGKQIGPLRHKFSCVLLKLTGSSFFPGGSAKGLSTTDRIVKSVPAPPTKRLKISDIFESKTSLPKTDLIRDHLHLEGRLEENAVLELFNRVRKLLSEESNVVEINSPSPVNVIGDIHGQFYDLMTVFKLGNFLCKKLIKFNTF